jgi:hypothetical protein
VAAQRDVLIEALSAELGADRRVGGSAGAEFEELPEAAELGWVGQAGTKVAAQARRAQVRWAGRLSRVDIAAPVAVPDEVIRHEPGLLAGSGRGAGGGREHRQMFDIPPISVRVTGHQLIARRCCGGCTSASTGKYSLIFVHNRRGTKGMDAVGVLPCFAGVAGQRVDGRTARPGPASDRLPGRLPAVHRRPAGPRQQCRREGSPDGQAAAERSPDACGPSLEPNDSAPSAATSRPPPNTVSTSSQPSPPSPRAVPGCPKPPDTALHDIEDLTSYVFSS